MTRMRRSPAAVAASVALALVLLAAADGGYGPTAGGLGTIGAGIHTGGLQMATSAYDTLVPVVAHEIGHNVGHIANSYRASARISNDSWTQRIR